MKKFFLYKLIYIILLNLLKYKTYLIYNIKYVY